MTSIQELENDSNMEISEYTFGLEIYSIVQLFFSLAEALDMRVMARKDGYGNVTFYVEKK